MSNVMPQQPVAKEGGPPWRWPRAAYVHIPFCAHHCGYCDFAVAVGQEDRAEAYIEALGQELSRLQVPRRVATLFLGGGTPSHLAVAQQARLFDLLARWLIVDEDGEVSLEANPDDVSEEKARLWAERGVTRLSLGAQSFRPQVLRVLERRHNVRETPRAVDRARKHVQHVALDLIFAVPGQSLADWESDLDQLIGLAPDHVSTYGLTYEKGTRLWKDRAAGRIAPVREETELAMYLAGRERLAAAGFEHYEVSNYARPGRRSRHNQVYWANEAHWGFGMGAASYVEGVRRLNVRDLTGYISRVRAGRPTHFQEEQLPPRERALETVATQLRRLDGIERRRFLDQTGFGLDELLGSSLARLIDIGMLDDVEGRVALTRRGLCVADRVIEEAFRGAQ